MSSSASIEGNQPVVIDNGTGVIKAGFAGSDKPKVVFRNIVGRTKHVRVMPGGLLEGSDFFVGGKAEDHRGSLLLSYPVEHGIIQNWSDMEKIWHHVYSKDNLNVSSEEHAVLLTESPLNPISSKDKMAEFFFEGLNSPALYFAIQAILSLYASGRTTGIVLDVGDGVTHSVPVYEGFALTHSIMRMDVAGRDVTRYLQLLLRRSGHTFTTTAEFEIVRQIKENCCSVAAIGEELALQSRAKTTYQLPDGTYINLNSGILSAPEVLFTPSLIGCESKGLHDCLVTSIMKSDMDLRRVLFSQIVLSGGSTLFGCFGDRLLDEVRRHPLSPKDMKVRIAAPPERLYTTWIGGSILASLSTFKSLWILRSEYLEQGSRIFRYKDF